MPKVFHLIKSLGRGGAEMLLPETLRAHNENEFQFSYGYFVPHKNQMVPALESQGVTVKCFNSSNPIGIISQSYSVAKFAKMWEADLIHCHLPLAGVSGRLAGKISGIPIIYTEHNKQERYHPFTRKANLLTMPINKLVLTVSKDVEYSLKKAMHRNGFPIRTLLNGVDTAKFDKSNIQSEIRKKYRINKDALVVGTVAVFRDQKRLDLWLELAKKIAEKNANTFFLMIGDGPNFQRLKELAKNFRLEDKVVFPGRLEEVRPWMEAMDIYLMTSEFEGLPIAMLEAMSMQLPVVATKAGGIAEVITDGKDGFLTAVENWPYLLQPLLELAQNPALRKKIGTNARDRVIAHFSIERMAKELEEIYKEVINDG